MKSASFFITLLLALLLVLGPGDLMAARLQVFGSFEDPDQLADLKVSEGVSLSASELFPAWGPKSLAVSFSSQGGTIEMSGVPEDWSRQESLLLFVWCEAGDQLEIGLRDVSGNSASRLFSLRRGANHLQWRLSEVAGIDLGSMKSLTLRSGGEGRLLLDYFALDRYHPVIAERGRWDVGYSLEVETPHVPWGRPLSGGPIHVYALSPVRDGRGIVELAQRLELDLKVTTIGRSSGINKWGFGDFYEQRSPGGEFWSAAFSLAHAYIADDLLFGSPCDVIVWPGLHPWEQYPSAIRDEIARRVREGAGLVLVSPIAGRDGGGLEELSPLIIQDTTGPETEVNLDRSKWSPVSEHFITRGVDLEAFPWGQIGVVPTKSSGETLVVTENGNPVVAIRQFGKGRVVALAYPQKGLIPEVKDIWSSDLTYPYHDYMWSMVAKAVMWAAKREPRGAIRSMKLDRDDLVFELDEPPTDGRLWIRVRDDFGDIESEATIAAPAGRTVAPLKRGLRGGKHFVEARMIGGDGVHDWASLVFSRAQPIEIRDIRLGLDRVRHGERVPVELDLSAGGRAAGSLRVRLFDNLGRLLSEGVEAVNVEGSATTVVELSTQGALTHLAKVDCEVSVNGIRSSRRVRDVFILQPRNWDDYDIAMYRFGVDPMPGTWQAIDKQFRKLNVTTLAAYSMDHSRQANYFIQAQTRISGQESPDGPARDNYTRMKAKYLESGDKRVLVREYCLNDPAYREQVRQELGRMLPQWVPFSPTSYYVYEEPSLTCYGDAVDICYSRYCMEAMRQWLKETYGSLDKLNRQWGTGFARWEDVIPDDSGEAQKRGNYASWADHRTFMERSYASFFQFVLEELRKYDPEGILLNSGTQISGSHNGCDYSRINRFTEHLNAYSGGNQLDFHRCFNPALKISGGAGYGVLGKDVLFNFYSNLFKGANAGAYIFWEYSTLNPDLRLCQSGRDMQAGFQELRGEGIGRLVGRAVPDNHGIAIHYSYPSIHGAWIVDGQVRKEVSYRTSKTFNRFEANRDGWVQALRDAGLQFDFIAYSDVAAGGLIQRGYKVLILPMSIALSDAEVGAIKEFVQQGGKVIADALPGIMDDHTTFREERTVADLFGIQPGTATPKDVIGMTGEPAVNLTSAKSLGEDGGKPMLLANSYGRGSAYLLNFFLDEFPAAKLKGEGGVTLGRVKGILKAAGLRPKVELQSLSGQPVRDCAAYLFNNGSTRLFGVVPDRDRLEQDRVRVVLEEEAVIYDVRRKRVLGSGKSVELSIQPAVPELLAFVEAEVSGVDLRAVPRARPGDEIILRFGVRGASGLRSVAKVEVFAPDGSKLLPYSGNRDIVDGTGTAGFRTALNDPTGSWKVRVTEVISGETAEATVRIE